MHCSCTASTAFMQLSFRLCSDINIKITYFQLKNKTSESFLPVKFIFGRSLSAFMDFLGGGKSCVG